MEMSQFSKPPSLLYFAEAHIALRFFSRTRPTRTHDSCSSVDRHGKWVVHGVMRSVCVRECMLEYPAGGIYSSCRHVATILFLFFQARCVYMRMQFMSACEGQCVSALFSVDVAARCYQAWHHFVAVVFQSASLADATRRYSSDHHCAVVWSSMVIVIVCHSAIRRYSSDRHCTVAWRSS